MPRTPCRVATVALITIVGSYQAAQAAQQHPAKGAGVRKASCERMIPACAPHSDSLPGEERALERWDPLLEGESRLDKCPMRGYPERMPPCIDDEDRAPATMPYAEDSESQECGPVSRWRRMPNDYSGCEESEPRSPLHRADCQEDPAYPYQYPGCPYIGPATTPGVYHRLPAMPEERRPKDLYQLPMHHTEPEAPGNFHLKKQADEADCPTHPEVDTMEFRRSDAKEGEFDRSPFNRPY
jgi:hypothetical protein